MSIAYILVDIELAVMSLFANQALAQIDWEDRHEASFGVRGTGAETGTTWRKTHVPGYRGQPPKVAEFKRCVHSGSRWHWD